MTVKMYRVGGCVRDKLMGINPKDIDFSVEAPSYDHMKQEILALNGDIFLENEEYLTIRARVPGLGAADFVLCRKDGDYSDGRHPDNVIHGTLLDDLSRRDFTMNAIAEAKDGTLIDPHNGVADIESNLIRCVGCTTNRFKEDYLRMLRAIRFSITKNMRLSATICNCLEDECMVQKLREVKVERIQREMLKCFQHDTFATLKLLQTFEHIGKYVFETTSLWLKPTLENKTN